MGSLANTTDATVGTVIATDSAEVIRKTVFECLSRVKLERSVRLLGVRVGNLEKRS